MPLLSIVIPVYNAENYLDVCIRSVLGQDFTDFEVLLINDGSLDGSLEICQRYAREDKRVVVFDQKNQGQAGARNQGLEMARGKYIGFCDNDDILHPSIFRVLIDHIESSGADISACSFHTQELNGNISHDVHTGETCYLSNHEGMSEFLSREKVDIYVWTKIYNKVFLDSHGIRFERGRNDEDFLFNHLAFLYTKGTIFTDKALYTYSVRESSESRVYYKKDMKRYLHNTLYRTYKIESTVKEKYPDLLVLAKRQTILYNIMMIGRIIQGEYHQSEPYFSYIMRYQKENKEQVIRERNRWGMSLLGVRMMVVLSPRFYYMYRRLVKRIRTRI